MTEKCNHTYGLAWFTTPGNRLEELAAIPITKSLYETWTTYAGEDFGIRIVWSFQNTTCPECGDDLNEELFMVNMTS